MICEAMAKIIHITEIKLSESKVDISLDISGESNSIYVNFAGVESKYLTVDRIDAVIVGLALFAIKNGYDFKSEYPISETLKYNLEYVLFPSLASNGLYQPKIEAPTCQEVTQCNQHVATGISCGVDSLFTIETHTKAGIPKSHRLTDLVFLNIGSHKARVGEQYNDEIFMGRRNLCLEYAKERRLNVIEMTSSLPLLLDKYDNGYSHMEYHTYMAVFCITWLQAFFSRYFYSSGYSFNDFNIKGVGALDFDAAFYDLLTLKCFSHGNLSFESCGGEVSRLEKVRVISENPLNCRYLNVCVGHAKNDGTCFKCSRTLLEIEAIGALDKYQEVFDIPQYRQNHRVHLATLVVQHYQRDPYALEIYHYFQNQISLSFKVWVLLKHLTRHCLSIAKRLYNSIK